MRLRLPWPGPRRDSAAAPTSVGVDVDAGAGRGAFPSVWNWFGHDEPNHAYTPLGRRLLGKLAALHPDRPHLRAHNLLNSGDGTPALRWGSTNVYTEDADGAPVYDWAIMDRIFDAYQEEGICPMVEIGFMPEALSTVPSPYGHDWPHCDEPWAGWGFPPKDYGRWADLVFRWVRHAIGRYGETEVRSWRWEVWNEPNIPYWQGTEQEYHTLYDHTADAVKRALPAARVGGPSVSGGGHEFLRRFLRHCHRGRNAATGGRGAPLDFITFSAKGAASLADGHVRMGLRGQLEVIANAFEVIASSRRWRHTPVILSESDPDMSASRPARTHPENVYRERPLYAAYTAAALSHTLSLAAQRRIRLEGVVTWAFQFEGHSYFSGRRELATNGIDKPILNLFRMLGLMRGRRLPVKSDGALGTGAVLRDGVRGRADVNALAAGADGRVSVLLWNYHDDDIAVPDVPVSLMIRRLPRAARHLTIRHFRVDGRHSNAHTAWLQMGAPRPPTAEQYALLEAAARLQRLGPDERRAVRGRAVRLDFPLPRSAVSLVELVWDDAP